MTRKTIAMIEKVISGGLTWPEIAALDAAIQLGIPYTGWRPTIQVPPPSMNTDGYRLQAIPSNRIQDAIAQNVKAADGTFIIAHGRLGDPMDEARRLTLSQRKQLLGIDLKQHAPFEAARLLGSWIEMNHIKTLYITGTDGGRGLTVYYLTLHILESTFAKHPPASEVPEFRRPPSGLENAPPARLPATVGATLRQLDSFLTLKEKTVIASSRIDVLLQPDHPLGKYIRQFFKLRSDNEPLRISCMKLAGKTTISPNEASQIIIMAFWQHLQKTHCLRIIK